MNTEYKAENARGSVWHRWDPHIHTPGTALNNQYTSANTWEDFLRAIETSDPPIRALGITDYCGIACYEQVLQYQQEGRLAKVGLIFPNIEFRLGIETCKGSGINIHMLFSPEDPEHVKEIKDFLRTLNFSCPNRSYQCCRDDLISLGKAHKPALTDDEAAYREGSTSSRSTSISLPKLGLRINGSNRMA